MAAHVGVDTTYDLTTPASGYTHEAEKDQSVDVATVRDENGVTVKAVPLKRYNETQTIKGAGDPNLAGVTAGAFSEGVVKVMSAKGTESADEFPEFEIVGEKIANRA